MLGLHVISLFSYKHITLIAKYDTMCHSYSLGYD